MFLANLSLLPLLEWYFDSSKFTLGNHQRKTEISKRKDSWKYTKLPRGTTVIKFDQEENIDIVGGHNDGDGALITGRPALTA